MPAVTWGRSRGYVAHIAWLRGAEHLDWAPGGQKRAGQRCTAASSAHCRGLGKARHWRGRRERQAVPGIKVKAKRGWKKTRGRRKLRAGPGSQRQRRHGVADRQGPPVSGGGKGKGGACVGWLVREGVGGPRRGGGWAGARSLGRLGRAGPRVSVWNGPSRGVRLPAGRRFGTASWAAG